MAAALLLQQLLTDRRSFLCGLCVLALRPGLAQGTRQRELRVVGTNFERIYERQSDGGFTGMGVELVRIVAQACGFSVRFDIYPWRRAQALVSRGEADLLVGPYKSAERQLTMAFGARPFFQDQVVFYARADKAPVWDGDYAALRGKRIVTLNGWIYGSAFSRALAGLQVSVANTVENGLNMLAYGRVDLFASNRRDTDPVIRALALHNKVVALAPLIDVQDAYFAFPLGERFDPLRLRFDQVMQDLAARGELQKLARRFEVSLP